MAERSLPNTALRDDVAAILRSGQTAHGWKSKLARKHGVSRERVRQIAVLLQDEVAQDLSAKDAE